MKSTVESSASGREPGAVARHSGRGRDQLNSPVKASQADASQGSGSEGPAPDLSSLEDVLAEMVRQEVARRFQSAKDKRWAALEKKYRALSEHREAGVAAETATTHGEEEPEHKDEAPSGPAEGEGVEERILSLANLPGLRANEEAIATLLRHRDTGNETGYLSMLEDLLALTLGDAPSDLQQAYQRRKAQLRPGDINALTALKREFWQKGLDIF